MSEGLTQPEISLNRELLSRLNTTLKEMEDKGIEVRPAHGAQVTFGEKLDLDFLPDHMKVTLLFTGETEVAPTLYIVKSDAHSPDYFEMPDGNLVSGRVYNVTGFTKSNNGLSVGVAHGSRGRSHFFADSLDNLDIRVIENDPAEQAQAQLKGIDAPFYEFAQDEAARLSRLSREMEQSIALLPAFDIDGPYRYSVDLFIGGTLYLLQDDGTLQTLDEFGAMDPYKTTRHGHFWGNRLEIVNDKVLLIDEQTRLALGSRYVEEPRPRYVGFSYLSAVDTTLAQQSSENAALLEEFSTHA